MLMFVSSMTKTLIEKRWKYVPALIKSKESEIFIHTVNRNVKVYVNFHYTFTVFIKYFYFSRTHGSFTEKSETSIVTESRTDYGGSAPKR